MLHRGKLLVFLCSALVALYGAMAAFYGRVVARDKAYPALSVFMDALNKINEEYVEAPDMNRVQEGAMRGLIEALDPYSSFLTREQAQEIERRAAEAKAGAGLVLSKIAETVYVVAIHRDGAAQKAGIRPGDYLVAVDGTGIEDKGLLEVESLMKGSEGSPVRVTVFRSSHNKPMDIEVIRAAETPATLGSRMLADNIGLLEVPSLAGTVAQVRVKLKTLISAGAQRILIDLRDCAEGEAAEGAELANFFLRSGVIYTSQNRKGETVQEILADPVRFVTDLPVALIINGSTAGAAEIAAAALKDHKRATLVGEKSFGFGSVQKRVALKSGAVLVLTVAKYHSPLGKVIQDEGPRNSGVKPDVQAPDYDRRQDLLVESHYDSQEEEARYRQLREKIYREQLEKAIEVLSQG